MHKDLDVICPPEMMESMRSLLTSSGYSPFTKEGARLKPEESSGCESRKSFENNNVALGLCTFSDYRWSFESVIWQHHNAPQWFNATGANYSQKISTAPTDTS